MRFKYEGHDAAGKERNGVVEARSIEEAAGIIRTNHKVYARKLEPDDSVQPEVNQKLEALKAVRAQAEVCDNPGLSKPHVYIPSGEQAAPGGQRITENPFVSKKEEGDIDLGGFVYNVNHAEQAIPGGVPVSLPGEVYALSREELSELREQHALDQDQGCPTGCQSWVEQFDKELSAAREVVDYLEMGQKTIPVGQRLSPEVLAKLKMELVKLAVTRAWTSASGK